jgi:hypothetical protein
VLAVALLVALALELKLCPAHSETPGGRGGGQGRDPVSCGSTDADHPSCRACCLHGALHGVCLP